MHVNILSYTTGKRRVLATVRVADDGGVQIAGALPAPLRDLLYEIRANSSSAEAFLERLPQQISGSYIRAERIL